MGSIDKMDWLINKYRMKIRAKKWYFPLFTNMIDMAVVNAHVLYCMANKNPTAEIQVKNSSYVHENLVDIRPQKLWLSITQQKYAIACSRRSAKERIRTCIGTHSQGKAKEMCCLQKQCSKAMHKMQCWAACKLFSCMASKNV